jgi:glutaconate CoA-transferase subunit B
MVLSSVHAGVGVTLEQVRAEVGWDIKVSRDLVETPPPTDEELRVLHEKVDPKQIWVGGKRQRPPIG